MRLLELFYKQEGTPPGCHQGRSELPLLSEAQRCVAGASYGITYFTNTDYPEAGVYDDQEGFVVLVGEGWATVRYSMPFERR